MWLGDLVRLARFGPHLLVRWWHRDADVMRQDQERWSEVYLHGRQPMASWRSFLYLMWHFPEYRSVFYFRAGRIGKLLAWAGAPERTLFIATRDIGPGLFFQHGFATIVTARRIGVGCWINQQVTIGYSQRSGCPSIGDHVTINAGAKVLGGISVGNHVVIGANAVVTKDVPDNVTVAGVPARIIRRNGVRVDEAL